MAEMNNLMDLVVRAERLLDMDRILVRYHYAPCYNDVVNWSLRNGVPMENRDGSHFGWYTSFTQEEVDYLLKFMYYKYIKKGEGDE